MNRVHLLRRTLTLCAGLCIMAFGVGFSIRAGLGTSPISSLPYTVSRLTPLTVGTATIAMHCVLILLQILLLRKRYQPLQLLQLPVAILFGYLTDFAVWAVRGIPVPSYAVSVVLCLIGILLVGIGVSFEVQAKLVPLAGEGLVLAVCQTTRLPFPACKIGFDCTLVLLAVVLGLLFRGQLLGVREGTIAAALLVGLVSRQATRLLFSRRQHA